MTFNKIDGATALKKAGIPLPENWGKLSTSRAEAFVEKAFATQPAEKPKKKGLMGRAAAAIAGAVAGAATAVADAGTYLIGDNEDRRYAPVDGLDKAARKNATMKVYSDPKYRKTTNRMRRFMASNKRHAYPTDPVPMTRQVARRKALDAGLPASYFRQFMGV